MKGIFVIYTLLQSCLSLQLDSSSSSFAQYHKWNVALNGTLSFEFKTDQPNGLLLYTDDGGTYDFFEIKLVEGALRLRYNLGAGTQIITVGQGLNDRRWHKVTVKRNDNKTVLKVDNVGQSRTSKGKEFQFGNLATNSDVYIGGMPSWYNTKLTRLALPSVIFEPRFNGAVRNLVYVDAESSAPKHQRVKRSSKRRVIAEIGTNVAVSSTDICETEDPCQNGGVCITTDDGPVCDCSNIEFEGTFCEKVKPPSEATFYGKEYVEYHLIMNNEAATTTQETINFSFRTKYSNGFLFHSGNEEDYLNVAIKDGGISLLMKVTTGKLDIYIKPNRIYFDDYRWHKVSVHRRIKEISAVTSFCRVSLTVDGIYSEHASTAGTFTMLASSKLYVGGSENTRALPGSSTNQNFVGCLRKLIYEIDGYKFDIFNEAKNGSKLITVGGQLSFVCRSSDASDAISFTTPDSYLTLPDWEAAQAGTFAIKFRTSEPHGLLVFSKAQGTSFSDVFAIELIEGQVYMIMDLGAGTVKEQVGIGKMNDGFWHSVLLHREGRNGRVAVDGFGIEFSLPGESRQLDLGSGLFIGGLPWQHFVDEKFSVLIWSGVLKRGFVGCIRELILNDVAMDMVRYAEEQDIESIEPVCRTETDKCKDVNPCYNHGECVTGWNRFTCDCSRTEFIGPTCSKISPILNFNGNQTALVKMPANTKHQVEDITIRFKTARPVGLLMATTHKSGDTVEIGVFGGKIRLLIKINNREKAIVNGDQLNDNSWHTVKYLRYGAFVLVQVDNRRSVKIDNIFTEFDIMSVNHIHIGGYVEVTDDDLPLSTSRLPKFIGAMQRIIFNGIDYIETAKTSYLHEDDTTMPQVKSSALYTKEENLQTTHQAFTILSKNTFVGLSPFKSFSTLNIYFQFKTKEPNGLITYSGGKKSDYLAVELASGHIYVFLQMKSELIKIKDGAKSSFSDNRWHTVSVRQPTRKIYTLQVDDIIVAATRRHDVDESLQLAGILFVGGIPSDIRNSDTKPLRSKHGFQGCLANIHLNEESPDLVRDALLPSTLIIPGCEGSGKRCNHNTCDNRGVCVQQWNSQICDCSMTSYTGPTCSEESIAYEFGPGKGLITYTFPEDRRPEMKSDLLALGFVTDKDDAVLFRVDSGSSNDYLELEIVEGNIFMVYNMGTQDQPIGEIGSKVNDNAYHIIRFTRNGANSTLQLDDFNTHTIFPAGHQLSVFNNQAAIQIGGKWNRVKQRIERPFGGIISGLVFNGLRILDLASEKDRRTEIRGDVTRVNTIKNRLQEPMQYQQMQPTPATSQPQVTDDLIFSGAGSGCNVDDEDHCKVPVDNSRSDDLITPVYVAPTRRPGQKSQIPTEVKPCDDEDCVEGSGYPEVIRGPVGARNHADLFNHSPSTYVSVTETDTSIPNSTFSGATQAPFTPRSNITSVPIVTVISVGVIPFYNESSTVDRAPFHEVINTMVSKIEKTLHDLNATSSTSTSTTTTETPTPSTAITSATTTSMATTKRYVPPTRPPSELPPVRNRAREAGAAITIIIISAILIVIIVITILVLLFNRKSETNYKLESHKNYNNNQNAAERKPLSVLLPRESHHQNTQSNLLIPSSNINNNLRMVSKTKKRQDVKEWYV